MKILFFGTPGIAVPFLARLCEREHVVAVVTQPDRPASRGQKLTPPPVKELALSRGIPVYQPERFDDAVTEALRAAGADVGVVVSYGNLIPETVFQAPVFGCFNIHFSLLPSYRGAAPIQWALIDGATDTGVTTFWLEKTLDSGPILLQERVAIGPDDDAITLKERLTLRGIELMMSTLQCLREGRCAGKPQEGTPTFAPSLRKEAGRIDWTRSARSIVNQIRGTRPWPGAFTVVPEGKLAGSQLKIVHAVAVPATDGVPGQILSLIKGTGFIVRCGEDGIMVDQLQPANRPVMSAWAFLSGAGWQPGTRCG